MVKIDERRNHEGYMDLTAYYALRNIENDTRYEKTRNNKRSKKIKGKKQWK